MMWKKTGAAATLALLFAAGGAGLTHRAAAQELGGDGIVITVDEKLDKKTIILPVGGTLIVRLESNPTTGYSWRVVRLAPSGAVSRVGKSEYIKPNPPPGMVGMGGTQVFRFKAQTPGAAQLRLEYWEPGYRGGDAAGHKPARSWSVTLAVAKP